jgi:adenine-specific DNA methylase
MAETRSAHNIHPYPCKYPGEVVRQWLPKKPCVIFDPYCGSGTTLLEATFSGHTAIGVDCNPIAILIAKTKTANLTEAESNIILAGTEWCSVQTAKRKTQKKLHEFEGRDHWFTDIVQNELSIALEAVEHFEMSKSAELVFKCAISSIVNMVSNQDSETRYCRNEKGVKKFDVVQLLQKRTFTILSALHLRGKLQTRAKVVEANFLKDDVIKPESIDAIVTSPPYANTMDYYLYHKQRMNVLSMSFRSAMTREIGSRHEFSSKKAPAEKWRADYMASLAEMHRCLRDKGLATIVIGDSQIAGKKVCAKELTLECAKEVGFIVESCTSIAMSGKSRTFQASFQRPGKYEHTICLKKKEL